jgi:hypothetical protein
MSTALIVVSIIAGCVTIAAGLFALWRYTRSQIRTSFAQEAATKENTEATKANTEVVSALSRKMEELSGKVDRVVSRQDLQGERLTLIEGVLHRGDGRQH